MNQSINGQKNWIYPVLGYDEILSCMNELNIPLTREDLDKPTAVKMQVVYTAFADIIMGVTKEYFDAAVEACANEADHFDIYADSLLLMVFYRHLRVLMKEVGYPEFSLVDITKPEPKRVRHILSAIINFAKFREERLDVYEKFTEKAQEYAKRLDSLTAQNEDYIRRIEELKRRYQQEEPLVQNANSVNLALTNDLYSLKKVQSQLSEDYDKLKIEKDELTTRLSNNSIMQQNAERECQKVRARIVHSPEKLRQQLVDMNLSLTNERQFLNERGKSTRELIAKIDGLTQLSSDVQSCISLMEECSLEQDKVESAHKKVILNEENLEKKRIEVQDLSKREKRLHELLLATEDKVLRAKQSLDSKRQSASKRMANITSERQNVLQYRAQIDLEMDKKKLFIDSIQSKILDIHSELENDASNVKSEYSKLVGHVELYMNEMDSAMNTSIMV